MRYTDHLQAETQGIQLQKGGKLGKIWRLFIPLLWVVFILLAFYLPDLRDQEGFLTGRVILLTSGGIGLLCLLLGYKYWTFSSWLVLGLAGQAASLQLIEAGKAMRYQHYKPFDRLWGETHPLILFLLGIQAIAVLVAFTRRWPDIRGFLARNFTLLQLAGLAVIFSVFSATVSHDLIRYAGELLIATWLQAINLLNLILIAAAIPAPLMDKTRNWLDQLLGRSGDQEPQTPRLDKFALLAAAWVTLLAAVLSVYSYERHPHIPDEVAYLYQARFLSQGSLTLPAPPVPKAFEIYLMQFTGGSWYPSPPPGWSVMLALGSLVNSPWLVNPILGGVNILLIYLVLGRLYSKRLARIAVLLLCLSPWFVFMAMNFMTHTFTLTCALVSVLGVMKSRETGQARWSVVSGAGLAMMSLIRPLEGLVMAGLIGLWAIGMGGKRLNFKSLAALVFSTAALAALVLPYNKALTGSAMAFPINVYTDQRFGPNSNAYGFGPDRGMGWPIDPNRGHTPIDALINADLNTFSINIELFGWSTGSLLLIALAVFSGSYRKSDMLMLALIASVFIFYFFYYFSGGPDFGARYWYLMIVPLAALSVRGIELLEQKLSNGNSAASARVLAGVLLLSMFALVNFFPWRAIDKYHHYLWMRPDLRQLAKEYGFGKSLVLIHGNEHPDYASAFVYNPLDFNEAAPIYAWDRDAETRKKIVEAYPDRPVWLVDGPTITGEGYKVVAGPLSAASVIAGP